MITHPASPTSASALREFHLSPEQVARFHRDGFLAPLTACSPSEMTAYREHIERLLETPFVDDVPRGLWGHNRHLDDRALLNLSTLPPIVGAMQSVMGEDLLMWRTNFFVKHPGGKEIPWHQDRNYWPLEPEIVVSAWLAIDRADTENACVQVIPGSHRKLVKHVKATEDMAFQEMADTGTVDLSTKVDVVLDPGQFILFNERTLHHSEANRSNRRRMGLAIRVIIPQVRVLDYDSPSHRLVLISGRDPLGFNQPFTEPAAQNAC